MFLGIDFGTSGARACTVVVDPGAPLGVQIEDMARLDFGDLAEHEMAVAWREALHTLIAQVPIGLRKRLQALAIDGTSATLLACDADLNPLHPPLPYHDARAGAEAEIIKRAAGAGHPAASASSGLAKAMWLARRLAPARPRHYLNQADWLVAQLSGQPASDYHNALKLGLDPASGQWPAWMTGLLEAAALPQPVKPGADLGLVQRGQARQLGINPDCLVRAGTTDSIAAFLAAGVAQPGDAVTSLGTTLVLKLLSETRVDAGQYGVYSHWFGRHWLAGGASNAGGGVLRQHFSDAELAALSARIDPNRDSGLDYYPLPRPGERFPHNDPALAPRLEPRPAEPAEFLHGLLEGLARIEALGYQRLMALGATPPRRVVSAGGGSRNPTYTRIRARALGMPMGVSITRAEQQEACFGSARLACFGTALFPGERDD